MPLPRVSCKCHRQFVQTWLDPPPSLPKAQQAFGIIHTNAIHLKLDKSAVEEVYVLAPWVPYNPQHNNNPIMSPLSKYDSRTGSQPCGPCSNDFHGENTIMIQVDSHFDAFENNYTSPTFTNTSNYNMYFPTNIWASEAPAECVSRFVGDMYSPPIAMHCVSTPFISSPNSVGHTVPNGWQLDASHFMRENSGMPWWRSPCVGSGNHDSTIASERALKDGDSNMHQRKPESIFVSEATTNGSQHGDRADSLYPGPPRKKECDGRGPCQNTSIERNASALTIAPRYSSDPATSPMPPTPAVSFGPLDKEAQTHQRRPRSPRRVNSSSEKRRARQSPTSAASPSDQRNRNRIAANKCRIKTKAAIAELEATEREESLKHEQLSITLRSLQADVFALKSQILLHGICGDKLIQDYLNESARSLTAGCGPGDGSRISSSGSIQLRR